ncbi:MAG TPA: ABC transporter substrate-binding protein [Rhodospirillaceae bacterium]|nr:ABC transporter substrate-binding protein [Rhodospirillaceae bacterium]
MAVIEQSKPRPASSLVDVYYTICPVLNAANVAVELGWLDEEFRRVGARAIYLRSLPENAGYIPHFTHSLPNLFRDGGAIPTIQARADLTSTKLIGLTWTQTGGEVVVRADTDIHSVKDLKGRRIGLFKSLNSAKIDFQRATAERAVELALKLSGLAVQDVEIVDITDTDDQPHDPAGKPAELWVQRRDAYHGPEVAALATAKVDAIFSSGGRSLTLVESGQYKVIEDLSRYPDWTLQVANGPYTAAVNTGFAEAHPEIVVAYLRAAIRAGRWINRHPAAAAEIFKRVTFYSTVPQIHRAIEGRDLEPNLSARNLAAITIQKDFLRSHGYVRNDFNVNDWADDRYLIEALRTL